MHCPNPKLFSTLSLLLSNPINGPPQCANTDHFFFTNPYLLLIFLMAFFVFWALMKTENSIIQSFFGWWHQVERSEFGCEFLRIGQLFLLLDSLIVPCFSFLSSWLEKEVACNGGSWLESWFLEGFSMLFFSAIILGHDSRGEKT